MLNFNFKINIGKPEKSTLPTAVKFENGREIMKNKKNLILKSHRFVPIMFVIGGSCALVF